MNNMGKVILGVTISLDGFAENRSGSVGALYLNTQMRKDAGVDVGDTVHITLQYDPVPRMSPMPETLKAAFAKNKYVKERWHLQPRSHRKEAYLNSLRTKESLEQNVCKIIEIW